MEDKKRLLDIIDILDSGKKIIDVGTDHGLVPLYLAKNRLSADITATDISAPSLKKLEDKLDDTLRKVIKTKVTDGFKGLEKKDNQVAIIAGMGANTIIKIIDDSLDFAKNLDYLILASNVNTNKLREYLNENGFFIDKDFLSFENGKYYDILKVYYGKKQDLSLEEYYYGYTDIENKSELLRKKLGLDKEKNEGFLREIKKNSHDKKAMKKIEERIKAIREVEKRCEF